MNTILSDSLDNSAYRDLEELLRVLVALNFDGRELFMGPMQRLR